MEKKQNNSAIYFLFAMILCSLVFLFYLPTKVTQKSSFMDDNISDSGVGLVRLEGQIMDSKDFLEDLENLAKNPRVKALVVRINSPGGAVAPSQEIFNELAELKARFPVIASLGTVAASGGYYSAIGAQKIFASPGTLTGSIGVITQLTNLEEVSKFLKMKIVTFKSGAMKDAGNPFRPMTDDEKVLFQEMVDDIYDQFVGDVSKSRKIPVEKLKVIADGRVLTGRQAKKHGLIDEFGSLNKALDFARKEAKLKPDSPVILPDGEETEKLLKWFQKNLSESLSNILSDIAPENLTAFWNYFLKI